MNEMNEMTKFLSSSFRSFRSWPRRFRAPPFGQQAEPSPYQPASERTRPIGGEKLGLHPHNLSCAHTRINPPLGFFTSRLLLGRDFAPPKGAAGCLWHPNPRSTTSLTNLPVTPPAHTSQYLKFLPSIQPQRKFNNYSKNC